MIQRLRALLSFAYIQLSYAVIIKPIDIIKSNMLTAYAYRNIIRAYNTFVRGF